MKNRLLLIMLVGCFAGIVSGSTLKIDNNFVIPNNIGVVSMDNSLPYGNLNTLTKINLVNRASNMTGECDNPPPPPPDGTPVTPSCVDLDDEGQDPNEPVFGNTQKEVHPFTLGTNYVARYYKKITSTGVFEYYDERSVLVNYEGEEPIGGFSQGDDGKGFEIQMPYPYQVNGDSFANYRVDIVNVATGELFAKAYIEIHYMQIQMFPRWS